MGLQLIEAYIPKKYFEQVDQKLNKYHLVSYWVDHQSDVQTLIRMLVRTEHTEEVLNYLESAANIVDGFEIILFPVQTYIKRVNEDEEDKKKREQEERKKIKRASRHELYLSMEGTSKSDLTYIMFVILSAIVVTIGLIKNSPAIVIGGMVIAPLLGPVISLAFSAILGDFKLARSSFYTVTSGVVIAIVISILFSQLFSIPLYSNEFMARTQVDVTDVVLALASGAAGALSVIRNFGGTLVGVMVAVAILPPTIVLGMTLGAFMWYEALGALLLLAVNINSILLSAIIVFTAVGIRPIKYDEVKRANNSKKYALIFIAIIVLLLILTVVYSQGVLKG
jgi:uncharacterized hydrophobic protein (TIGR00341 family)